jgi:hypothetical protein
MVKRAAPSLCSTIPQTALVAALRFNGGEKTDFFGLTAFRIQFSQQGMPANFYGGIGPLRAGLGGDVR